MTRRPFTPADRQYVRELRGRGMTLTTLEGLCTQIDNLIAGYRIRLGELPP
jgi:hypothetical protein